jgi:hypothetical protein
MTVSPAIKPNIGLLPQRLADFNQKKGPKALFLPLARLQAKQQLLP